MILLLGQSVQDSMGLFVTVTLCACVMIYLIDNQRDRREAHRATI